jgi:hypothetical protein
MSIGSTIAVFYSPAQAERIRLFALEISAAAGRDIGGISGVARILLRHPSLGLHASEAKLIELTKLSLKKRKSSDEDCFFTVWGHTPENTLRRLDHNVHDRDRLRLEAMLTKLQRAAGRRVDRSECVRAYLEHPSCFNVHEPKLIAEATAGKVGPELYALNY